MTSSLDILFSKQELHQAERERFEEGAGWRYGLVFGLVLVLVGWGWDMWELQRASADMFWSKLLLATIMLIPLTALAGTIAARAHRPNRVKFIVWAVCGALSGLIAIHLPFEGAGALAALIDPAVRGVMIFPFPPAAEERVLIVVAFGALAGLVAAALQNLAVAWAWDRSPANNRISLDGWAMLLVSAPLAFGLAALFDGSANAQLRGPIQLANRRIQIALTTPPDLDVRTMETSRALEYLSIGKWRERFSQRYTEYISNFDRKRLQDVNVDAVFDNGFVWRCQSVRNGDDLYDCVDLSEEYAGFMRQFLQTGDVQCDDCSVHVEPDAAAWHAQQNNAPGDPKQISLIHHAGGVIVVRASQSDGTSVDCQFYGANLIEILTCAKP